MGKFFIGLIVGMALGVLATTVNPNLSDDLRAGLANLTAQVMRGVGQTADELGDAAEDLADRTPPATEPPPPANAEPPVVSGPAAPTEPGETGEPQ